MMTRLLTKIFIKDAQNTSDPNVRQKFGALSSAVGIAVNLVLALGKLFCGMLAGSSAIIADAFNNLSDSATSVITMLSFKASSKPADKEHPFGHARIEYIASLAVSFIIILVGGELFLDSGKKLIGLSGSVETNISILTLIILICSIGLKLWLGFFYRHIAKKIDSQVIKGAATDSFSDSLSTFAVLASSIVIKLSGWHIVDSIVGIAVSIPIIIAGINIFKETINILIGGEPVEETVSQIKGIIADYPEILDIHDLMVHNYGKGKTFASFHAEVDGSKDIYYLHDTVDNVERRISKELMISCTIHLDPIVTDDENVNELKSFLLETMKEEGLDIPIHDFRTVIGHTHTNMIFDVVLPFDHPLNESLVKEKISFAVQNKRPDCYCVITVDRG